MNKVRVFVTGDTHNMLDWRLSRRESIQFELKLNPDKENSEGDTNGN